MNILDAEDLIKGLPDDALTQEAQAPSGQVPQFLVVSEIQRRTDMRKRYENDQQQNQGTVAEQIVQEGIAGMMPQQPMGMPPQGMPQGMPPMGMAQGGIVQMQAGRQAPYPALDSFVAGANVGPMQGGSTIKDQLDRAIGLGATYPEMVSFIESSFTADLKDQARAYLTSKMQEAMPPTTMGANTRPMPSDISDMDMAFIANDRAKDQVAADIGSRFNYFQPPEFIGDAIEAFRGIDMGMPTREQAMAGDRAKVESIRSKLSPSITSGGIDDAIAGMVTKRAPRSGGFSGITSLFSDSAESPVVGSAVTPEMTAAFDLAESQLVALDAADDVRLTDMRSRPGQEPADSPIAETLPLVQEMQNDASAPDFSVMDDYLANLNTGDKSVQGVSPVQTQAKPPPKLEIGDILDESREMTQANMLMQLGAGIAGGDLSKGISAAGAAGMKGAQEQRALDIRKRLAEYQAGREDIARGDAAELTREKIQAELSRSDDTTRREIIRYYSDLATELRKKATALAPQGERLTQPEEDLLQAISDVVSGYSGQFGLGLPTIKAPLNDPLDFGDATLGRLTSGM